MKAEKVPLIADAILHRTEHHIECMYTRYDRVFVKLVNRAVVPLFHKMDKGFHVDDACRGSPAVR